MSVNARGVLQVPRGARRGSGRPAARGAERALAGRVESLATLRRERELEHEVLLRAARRVFLRKGYRQARVADVLSVAGLSTRAFYRLHASKGELFLELFDRANEAALARLREVVERPKTAVGRLDAYVRAMLDLAYSPRLRPETLLFASVPAEVAEEYGEEVRTCRAQLVSVLREILEFGRESGELPEVVPEVDSWLAHGAIAAALDDALGGVAPGSAREGGRAALVGRGRVRTVGRGAGARGGGTAEVQGGRRSHGRAPSRALIAERLRRMLLLGLGYGMHRRGVRRGRG